MIHRDDFGVAGVLAALPAFFAEPRLLSHPRHAGLGVRRGANLRYAATMDSAPLGLEEFGHAMRTYPILFEAGPTPRPVALLGLSRGANAFVDALGGWRRDHYVPACLQRYPVTALATGDEWQLCADFASGRIVTLAGSDEPGVEPLFEPDGRFARYARAVIARSQIATRKEDESLTLARALAETGILVPCDAPLPAAEAGMMRERFLMVSEEGFRGLSASLLAEFARLGWLEPIVMAVISRQNWQGLAQLCGRQRPAASARIAA